MSKSTSQAMQYEVAGNKKITDGKGMAINMAETVGTMRLFWIILKRHKVAILAVGNVILVLNWAVPAWPEIVKSLF